MKPLIFKLFFIFIIIFSNQLYAARTIGVTKFENLTKNQKIAWLGIGIADSITQKLSRVKEFILVDRTNVEKIMTEIELGQTGLIDEKSAKSVGKALGADIIVTGNYAKYGNRIRISAKFVEVESHRVLKQVQSTGSMLNIFELQDEIALKLIKEGNIKLTNKIKNRITSDYKVKNLSAYEFYSKGRNYYTKSNYYNSIDMFQKAVSIDNRYDLAYTGLSKAYASLYWHESAILEKEKNPEFIEKSYRYAKKALKLNSSLDEAHVSMAKYYQNVDKKKIPKKWKKCREEAQKALDINPNNAEAYYILSRANAANDKKEKKYLDLALEKNKFLVSAQLQMGIFYYDQKKYNKAEPYMKRAIEIEPRFILGYSWLGYLYNKMGDKYKAIELYENALKRDPNYVFGLRNLGVYYRQVKKYDKAMEQFQKAVKIKKHDFRSWYEIGYLYQQKNDYKKALKHYKISHSYKSNYYFTLSNMAYTYSMLKQYNKAVKFAIQAHNIDTKKDWPAGHLGWIYRYKLKDKSKAKYWYRKALKRNPRSAGHKKALKELGAT